MCCLWDWFNTFHSLNYQGQVCNFTFRECFLSMLCILWAWESLYFNKCARINAAFHTNCVLWVMDSHYKLLFLIYLLNKCWTVLTITVLNVLMLLMELIYWESGLDRGRVGQWHLYPCWWCPCWCSSAFHWISLLRLHTVHPHWALDSQTAFHSTVLSQADLSLFYALGLCFPRCKKREDKSKGKNREFFCQDTASFQPLSLRTVDKEIPNTVFLHQLVLQKQASLLYYTQCEKLSKINQVN